MKKFYILHDTFCNAVNQFPEILSQLPNIDEIQRYQIIQPIDAQDIMKSAVVYFQNSIVMEGQCLYVESMLETDMAYIECCEEYILFDDEHNPFLSLLKRKYRSYFIRDCELT